MKTNLSNTVRAESACPLFTAAALALAITITLTSCGKGGGDVKLLESRTYSDGRVEKYEYDKQNRLVKIDNTTITYNSDDLITVGDKKFVIKGNTVTVEKDTLTIDKDGYIVERKDGTKYKYDTYKDGNLIHVELIESGYSSSYSYDDKKSPFSNCTTPKWLLSEIVGQNKNNVVSYSGESGEQTYKYEYDSEGFPVTVTVMEKSYADGETITTIRYTYRGGKPAEAAQTEQAAKPAAEPIAEPANEEKAAAALQFAYSAEYSNKKMPMTVFYSSDAANIPPDFVDSIVFQYDGKKQSLAIDKNMASFSSSEISKGFVLAGDYNFDGYMDIAVLSNSDDPESGYSYYIYNNSKQSYHYNETLSSLKGISFDAKTQTVGGTEDGMGIYNTYKTYKWDGSQFVLTRSNFQEFFEDSEGNNVRVSVTRSLQNGKWTETRDTVR